MLNSTEIDEIISLVKTANRRGFILFIDTDGQVKVYPASVAKKYPTLLTGLSQHYRGVHAWLKIQSETPSSAT